jgi:hypothetical protein
MNYGRDAYVMLVRSIAGARQAFRAGLIADAVGLLDDARHWALMVGNPWTVELGEMVNELDPALGTFRDIEERFDALFPEDEPSGDPDP